MIKKQVKGSALLISLIMVVIIIGVSGVLLQKTLVHNNWVRSELNQKSAKYASMSGLECATVACRQYKDEGRLPVEIHGNCRDWNSVIVKLQDGTYQLLKAGTATTGEERVLADAQNQVPICKRPNGDFKVFLQHSGIVPDDFYTATSSGVCDKNTYAFTAQIESVPETANKRLPRNAADTGLVIKGNAEITSGPTPNVADFKCNESILIGGNGKVYGTLHPGPDTAPDWASSYIGSKIVLPTDPETGETMPAAQGTSPLTEKMSFPPIVVPEELTATPVSTYRMPSGRDKTVLWSGRLHFSDLKVSGQQIIKITGNTEVLVDDDFHLSGQAKIEISSGSTLTMYVADTVKLTGNGNSTRRASESSLDNIGQDPNAFKLYVGFDSGSTPPPLDDENHAKWNDIHFTGNSNFCGIIYAPKCFVKITGNAEFYGNVVARAVMLAGSPHGDRFKDYTANTASETTVTSYIYKLDSANTRKTAVKDL